MKATIFKLFYLLCLILIITGCEEADTTAPQILVTQPAQNDTIHAGEQLCGDHVDIVEQNENSTVIVLADGLGSGVKASILSTLTSKIISTMIAADLPLEECVSTIAATLPVCSVRGVAYSTFTILHLWNNETAELIQYDNPHIILIRDFEVTDYPKNEMIVGGKNPIGMYRRSPDVVLGMMM